MGSFKLGKMTMKSLFGTPETICYPAQTKSVPKGLKGHIEVDMSTCILCSMCAKCCPAGAIEVDKKQGTWSIDPFRCVQCASCTRACPKDCLQMLPTYWTPTTQKGVEVFQKPVEETA